MPHSAVMTAVQDPALSSLSAGRSVSMLTAPSFFHRTCALLRVAAPSLISVSASSSRAPTCRRIVATSGMHNGVGDEHASATTTSIKHSTTTLDPVVTEKRWGTDVGSSQTLAEQCERVHRRVYDLLAREPTTKRIREVQRQTRISLGVIGQALERYGLEELSFSYNGGKDCLVLLILYLAALHTHATGQSRPNVDDNALLPPPGPSKAQTCTQLPATLPSVYIVSPNPFPQVTTFVEKSSAEYHLSLAHYVKPMKEAFASYLHDFPSVRAIFVGTRRTDPHGAKLTHFDPTDGGWPAFMRIHPVIDWHYADVWTFIRELGVDYCELYDMGYTSLGGTNDTLPNPALEVQSTFGLTDHTQKKYRPAYELIEDEAERLGRER